MTLLRCWRRTAAVLVTACMNGTPVCNPFATGPIKIGYQHPTRVRRQKGSSQMRVWVASAGDPRVEVEVFR